MSRITEILGYSSYQLTQFNTNLIDALESQIQVSKDKNGNNSYKVKCQILQKEIKLSREEVVRQLYLLRLLREYGYPLHRLVLEYPISLGNKVSRADIVVMDAERPDLVYIIVEIKRPQIKDGKEQLKAYCNATGAPIGVWTNGEQISYYHRKDNLTFETLSDIPNANQSLVSFLSRPQRLVDLTKNDQLAKGQVTLGEIFSEIKTICQRTGRSNSEILEDLLKLVFIKLYDEIESEFNPRRAIEFRLYNDNELEIKTKIEVLFELACNRWEGIFPANSTIDLDSTSLAVIIGLLQDIKLYKTSLEDVVDAFEHLLRQDRIRDLYFIPLYLIDFCIKMLNPKPTETIIDPCTRSFLFPIRVSEYVARLLSKKMHSEKEINAEFRAYLREHVFALNENRFSIQLGKILNLFISDQLGNFILLNGLDFTNWDEKAGNSKTWIDAYFNQWRRLKKLQQEVKNQKHYEFDVLMSAPPFRIPIEGELLSQYELAKGKNRVFSEILYIERAIDLLADGGRMALILPQSVFSNTSEKEVREFIAEKCRILAVIGLHQNVFRPEAHLKTSIIFLQKWTNETGVNPKKADYSIFFATMRKPGKDSNGNFIYVKNDDNVPHYKTSSSVVKEPIVTYSSQHKPEDQKTANLKDRLIINQDLFNPDNLFQDGIAEAFIEFAYKERLSFF